MTLIFIRVFFIILSVIIGYQIGSFVRIGSSGFNVIGAALGFLVAMSIIIFEFILVLVGLFMYSKPRLLLEKKKEV